MPTIQELAIKETGGPWSVLASNIEPKFRMVSGLRRFTQQQTEPLVKLRISPTAKKLDDIKWDAFWDAPLYIDDKFEGGGACYVL